MLVIPFGDYGDGVRFGGGIALRANYEASPALFLTGRVGGLLHLFEDAQLDLDLSIRMLLVYAGLRFNIGTEPNRTGFVFGEAGLNRVRVAIGELSASENNVSINLGAGYQTGRLELRGSLFVTPSVGEGVNSSTLTGLMLSVGGNLAAW